MALQHQAELAALLSVIPSAAGQVWCTASHEDEVVLTPAQLKLAAEAHAVEPGVPLLVAFEALAAHYSYQAYCYIENARGVGMAEPPASTRVLFTTPDYPVLTLTFSAADSGAVDLDLAVSTPAMAFCRAREDAPNQLPPTDAWILEGAALNVTQAALPNYLTLSGLNPSSHYSVYCTAQTPAGLLSLQALAQRTVAATTAAGGCMTGM